MLEILSHQYLRKIVSSNKIQWTHIYSFGRIISNCIKNNSTYLINSEIFLTNDWVFVILISLSLNKENSTFILSSKKIEFLIKHQIDNLKHVGIEFVYENDQIIFITHKIRLITLHDFLNDPNCFSFKNHRIVLSGIEEIKQDLKNYFKIKLTKDDWFECHKESETKNQYVMKNYNLLKTKFFSRRVFGNGNLFLDKKEISALSKLFFELNSFSQKFLRVHRALSQGWACWVRLDNENLEWELNLEPIDQISQIRELLTNNKFVFLSALRKDTFFQKYLKHQSIDLDLVINFKSDFEEKQISIYSPPKQMLPNNPLFINAISDKCKKLVIFQKGLSVILFNDEDLKTNFATKLASMLGKRVLLETIPSLDTQILCASFDWWIKNSFVIRIPDQIIIPLLPIPNMSEPINLITVAYNKKLNKDWFREFLLPEAIIKLERSISPLRRNSGKLVILDGRANKRKWGRLLLQSIQPAKQINYMLPFD